MQLPHDQFNLLVNILVKKARVFDFDRPSRFYGSLMREAELSDRFRSDSANFTGNVKPDAQGLIERALSQKTNAANRNYTTLGSLLKPLLDEGAIDIDDQRAVAGIIYLNGLIRTPEELENIATRFSIPREAQAVTITRGEGYKQGPDFEPHFPQDERVLQGLFDKKPPSLLDLGTLRAAMKCASSVCRIVFGGEGRGTGFRLKDNLVLTNFHVLNQQGRESEEAMIRNAQNAKFQFGYESSAGGQAITGQTFEAIKENPIVKKSPIDDMDYALLRIDEAVMDVEGIGEVEYALETPATSTALNVIQHPKGEVMKLALSGNGVTWVSDDQRLVQYLTPAEVGSSGSPCFNSEWKMVALHHAEQVRSFGPFAIGTIREGILFSKIFEDLQKDPKVEL